MWHNNIIINIPGTTPFDDKFIVNKQPAIPKGEINHDADKNDIHRQKDNIF